MKRPVDVYIHRRQNQMKQNEVAKVLGVTPLTYCRKENGHRDFTIREAKILAQLFKTDLNTLFPIEDKEESH
ncbi:helix-turn-helix transcriptional regulator [Alkalicoccus luteus]|uniref:Helix-turn-helix transcriptional regulator n=1 Tax=Alkalicoccus luteus TaxID=1237094 RepID=A0A969PWY6_9BACI|nr:helix-turn-helix transcriptional regulator [Alkalicoccus luteus]NJP37157.1 helix-turn-helix transcriptional regulator [Alkalicoccus luteus]